MASRDTSIECYLAWAFRAERFARAVRRLLGLKRFGKRQFKQSSTLGFSLADWQNEGE